MAEEAAGGLATADKYYRDYGSRVPVRVTHIMELLG